MKIAGIIAEYDPFHNGHKRHIEMTRSLGCDAVVCVMSGHITQRGELAALSKWDRALAALRNGADMVVELPAIFSCRTADKFADAGVRLLSSMGVDCISFGSEIDDIDALKSMADMKDDKTAIRASLKKGEHLAKARAFSDEHTPNVTLGVEYIRALNRLGSGAPIPVAIKRDSSHISNEISDICSAGAIREAVKNGDAAIAGKAVPDNARFQIDLMSARREIDDMYLSAVRTLGVEGMAQINDVSEGLEHRFVNSFREAATLSEALKLIKCKRYTYARISRIATHALTGLTKAFTDKHDKPEYIRVLGINGGNAKLTSEVKSRSTLPLLTPQALSHNPIFQFESRVTDIWSLSRTIPEERRAGQEFTRKFIRA